MLFRSVHKALGFFSNEQIQDAVVLLTDGRQVLNGITEKIDSGKVRTEWEQERKQWRLFVDWAEQMNEEEVHSILEQFITAGI